MRIDTIDHEQLERMLPDARVVDVAPVELYRREHLPGALNILPDEVDDLAPRLLPGRDTPVVVYGNGDRQAIDATCERLVELGYTNVHEFPEGREGWAAAGLPIESGPVPPIPPDPVTEDHEDWLVDVASWESFPASDPPAHSPLRP